MCKKVVDNTQQTYLTFDGWLLGLLVGVLVGRLVGSLVELAPPKSKGALVGAEVGDDVVNGITGDVNVKVELVSVRFWFTSSMLPFIVSVSSVRLSGVVVIAKVMFEVSRRSSSIHLRAPQG